MKFDIPKIVRALDLQEYAAEWGSLQIQVWVNPPIRLLQEHDQVLVDVRQAIKGNDQATAQITIEQAAKDLVRIFAELWSQGAEETRWSEAEVERLVEETQPTDPLLWNWLRERTIDMIREHRAAVKKG